ncbi:MULTISPECIES: L-rhamnose mutarotase [unclassified Shinella]|uniref:L-rhamnose mutarotase n=1 Tax=unclassified Shinella TaxID=2643062 RepID=UPI00225CD3BD|nr:MULTISPECIES: L-rhamnose mutarotase [unclassified Shinella]MCO5137983.1 L-rhamnose mutarotase [Shinella sp.]MDC7258100.1 L-rhamnose mutarotase [Shinella sp. YE25]CAI0335145.1 L-rhamnose mutarotase [Rhizobiaceae bacterium]CAK7259456.1 L-rhamnose mutarotase [Shinella sp. WSC3-e]
MQRIGMVIGVKPEKIEDYKRLHAAVWPEVLAMISACNMRNYSIFLKEPENLLFSFFEYHGSDYAADMAKMAADAKTQEWWAVCMPCQSPLETRKDGEWWVGMEEVFFHA